jgi:biotin synthase
MRCNRSPLLVRGLRVVLQDGRPSFPRRYGTVSESPSLTTPPSSTLDDALAATGLRNTWTKDEIRNIYETPLMQLAAAAVSLLAEV